MGNKNVKRLLKDSEDSCLISTKNGIGVVGNKKSVLIQFMMLVRKLRENISDETLKSVFEDAFKTEEELIKELIDKLKKAGNK